MIFEQLVPLNIDVLMIKSDTYKLYRLSAIVQS